jgi:hypothetical protein
MTSHSPMRRAPLTHPLKALLEHDEIFRQLVVHPEARGEHLILQTTVSIARGFAVADR